MKIVNHFINGSKKADTILNVHLYKLLRKMANNFYTVPTELKKCYPNRLYVCSFVRSSRNVQFCAANTLDLPIFA